MAKLIDPGSYATVYDPTCGSGGLLIKARMSFEERHPNQARQAPRLYGQELNPVTLAMAKMNMFLHDYSASEFAVRDTFRNLGYGAAAAGLARFDRVVANPMWNQKNYTEALYENDSWGRFQFGAPPSSSAGWGWVQHIWPSQKDGARAAVVLDTGAASRGSGRDQSNVSELQIKAIHYTRERGSISNSENQTLTGVARRTAARDLEELENLGLVVRSIQEGRTVRYALTTGSNVPNVP